MNKIFRFFTIAAVAVCTLSYASCSSDDDDDNNSGSSVITGNPTSVEEVSGDTWVINYSKSSAYGEMNGIKGPVVLKNTEANYLLPTKFVFYTDGTVDVNADAVESKGSYSIDGREFTLTYNIGLNKTDTDGSESLVEKSFTLKKDADLSALVYGELGVTGDTPMSNIFTQSQISKSGNQLILNLTLTTTLNVGNQEGFDSSALGQYSNLFNNLVNSKKYVAYTLVYDKK